MFKAKSKFGRWPRFLREPFADATRHRSNKDANYEALDGLRGLAAVIVLTDHWRVLHNDDRGIVGVVVFFVLSGFLLTLSFVQEEAQIPTFAYVSRFFRRRFWRIYPLFFMPLLYVLLARRHHAAAD